MWILYNLWGLDIHPYRFLSNASLSALADAMASLLLDNAGSSLWTRRCKFLRRRFHRQCRLDLWMEPVKEHNSRMVALRMAIFWHLFSLTSPLSSLCMSDAFYLWSACACPSLLNIIILYKIWEVFPFQKPQRFIYSKGNHWVHCLSSN